MDLTAKISESNISSDYSLQEVVVTINTVKFVMKCVKGGTFMMGAQHTNVNESNYDSKSFDWEGPVHSVTLDSYYIAETLVSQSLWQTVMHSSFRIRSMWTPSRL